MSRRETLTSVPDATTAQLLEELLRDNGIGDVELKAMPPLAYMPRANAIEYEVRVASEELERARRVLADYEAESDRVVDSQAEAALGDAPPPAPERHQPRAPGIALVAFVGAIALFLLLRIFLIARVVE